MRRLLTFAALALTGCTGEAGTYPTATLESVSPGKVSARGGAALTVKGHSFSSSTAIALGGEPARSTLVSQTELTVISPPLWAGPARLTATNADGLTTELKGGIEVTALELRFVEAPSYVLPQQDGVVLSSVVARDFDGDRDVDLVVCGAGAACRLLTNDGRGNFTGPPDPLDAGAPDAGATDAGLVPDAGVETDGGLVAPLLGELVSAQVLGADDIDGDAVVDLVLATDDGAAFIAANAGDGTFLPVVAVMQRAPRPPSLDAGAALDAGTLDFLPITASALADFDGDGRVDLISAGATPTLGPFRIDLNASAPKAIAFTRLLAADADPVSYAVTALAVGDVDGDKRLDVVLATTGGDGTTLRLFLNREGHFVEVPGGLPAASGGPYAALAIADLTGDGAVEIVAVGVGQDRLLVNDGAGHFFDASSSSLPVDASKGTSVALVDLDRDRDLDLVIGNAGAATRLYVNDGAGKFTDRTPALPFHSDTVTQVCVTNVDGDGDQDMLLLTAGAAAARLYLSVEPSL